MFCRNSKVASIVFESCEFEIGQHFIEILRDATPIKSENKRMKKVFINANKMNLNSHLFVGSFFVLGFNLMCDHGNTLSMHSH